MQAVIEKTNLNPAEVGDIVVGTVLAPGSIRATECRMAAFYAGFPGIMLSPFLHIISCKLHFCALVLRVHSYMECFTCWIIFRADLLFMAY